MASYLLVLGSIFLMFRLWLCETKLKDELQFRRGYISRILNYYACITLIFDLQSDYFNIVMMAAIPLIAVSIIGWDSLFYKKFKSRTYWKKNHNWLIVERLTLHPPILALGLYYYFTGPTNYVDPANIIVTIIVGSILVFGPWFLLDHRWKTNYAPNTKRDITISAILSTVGHFLYFYFWA
jgi:hypothetical protein